MKRSYKKKPKKQKDIALERIRELFRQAGKTFKKDSKLADRYVELARRIAMKYKIRIPSELRKKFCRHCYRYLVPSVNCRVRVQKGKVVYCCLGCKKFMRFPYVREQKAKRKKK